MDSADVLFEYVGVIVLPALFVGGFLADAVCRLYRGKSTTLAGWAFVLVTGGLVVLWSAELLVHN